MLLKYWLLFSLAAVVSPSVWRRLSHISALSASLSLVCWQGRCRILQVGDIFSAALEFLKPTFLYLPQVLGFFLLLFIVIPPKPFELLENVDRGHFLYLIQHFSVLFFQFHFVAFCYRMVKFGLCLLFFPMKVPLLLLFFYYVFSPPLARWKRFWLKFLRHYRIVPRKPISINETSVLDFSRGYAKRRDDYCCAAELCKCVTYSAVNKSICRRQPDWYRFNAGAKCFFERVSTNSRRGSTCTCKGVG